MNQVSIPAGTRDFSPEVVRKRNYIINIIRNTFELYGFEPIETPAMENLETLMGKYGNEGDKLIFKILNNGDLIKGISKKQLLKDSLDSFKDYLRQNKEFNSRIIKELPSQTSSKNDPISRDVIMKVIVDFFNLYLKDVYLTSRALRYDLTIPFARYVAMNRGTISFPFKRYQIQPVWRADRPQKGRFREFYQCDADVVGSNALLNEVELLNIYATVFNQLGIEVELRINNRKILAGLAEWMQVSERLTELTISIDKLDKIGLDGVKTELQKNNFTENQIEKLQQFLNITGTTEEKLIQLNNIFVDTEIAKKGISELDEVLNKSAICNLQSAITIDTTLARGLNYYTGIIIEVKAKNVQMGSIGGGGRYDDLTGVFGLPNMSGVGISFGLDRIYEVMDELKLFPDNLKSSTQVLFINFGNEAEQFAFNLLQKVRAKNIAAEIYPSAEKVKKQMEYANKKQIAYVVLIGDEEMKAGKFAVKNMQTGNQQLCTEAELLEIAF